MHLFFQGYSDNEFYSMRRTRGHLIIARTMGVMILLVLPLFFHYVLPIIHLVPTPCTYCGMALMLLGLTLGIVTAKTFRRIGAHFQLHGRSSALATSGPFKLSRNPMYLSMLIWLTGLALFLGSLSVFLFPIFLFVMMNFLIIPLEEKSMEESFEERYREYKRHVRRWL